MNKKELASHLDNANHHANCTSGDIKNLCAQVLRHKFNSAFVNPYYVLLAKKLIKGKAHVGTIVGFPFGEDTAGSKIFSAAESAGNGADELDISMNVGMFKEKRYGAVLSDMKKTVRTAKKINSKIIVKFIIETGYLNDKEIIKAAELVAQSGADFVKTCSGYGPRGATIRDVKLIKKAVGNKAKIKVAGGITTTRQALAFIKAGAHRIGTSHAVEIVEGIKS